MWYRSHSRDPRFRFNALPYLDHEMTSFGQWTNMEALNEGYLPRATPGRDLRPRARHHHVQVRPPMSLDHRANWVGTQIPVDRVWC